MQNLHYHMYRYTNWLNLQKKKKTQQILLYLYQIDCLNIFEISVK